MTRLAFRKSAWLSAVLLTAGVMGALVAAPSARAQIVIDNPGNGAIALFGSPGIASFGQTITAPTGGVSLDSFSFTFANVVSNGSTASIPFRAYVFGYNSLTSMVTGPALFTSGVYNTPTTFPSVFTANTSATPVVAGSQYLLLFSTSGLQSGQPQSQYSFRRSTGDTYTGGQLVFMNNGNDMSALTTGTYSLFSDDRDLEFTATFGTAPTVSAVPEPSEYAMASMFGVTLVFGMVKARRKSTGKKATQSA